MSIAVKSGLPSLGSTEGAVISADEVSVSEDGSAAASVGEDLPRGKSAYEIAKENGFNGTETEWLASLKGEPGAAGASGKDGENGKTPYVGDNGNWYIGADDTGKPSRGAKGDKGEKGDTGAQGIQGEQGIQGVQGEKGDKGEKGAQGPQGLQGPQGKAGADGKTPNITIGSVTTLEAGQNATASMGGTAESPVLNLGIPRGTKGEPGSPGAPGADGKSAYQYAQDGGYTGTEAEFAEKLAKEIPEALPNPNALTFTGAVNATYDGSTAVSVEIPSGGSGDTDISLGLTSAAVGQIIKVKAIDESGKPTAWEAADMPSGGSGGDEWELIADVTISEPVNSISADVPSGKNELLLFARGTWGTEPSNKRVGFKINGKWNASGYTIASSWRYFKMHIIRLPQGYVWFEQQQNNMPTGGGVDLGIEAVNRGGIYEPWKMLPNEISNVSFSMIGADGTLNTGFQFMVFGR